MLKKMACIGVVLILIVSLTGCNKENKINEYDKENNIQVLESKELISDADYSEGNIVVPYIDINNSDDATDTDAEIVRLQIE